LLKVQTESNNTINALHHELEGLRKTERDYKNQTRELEILNSELEQSVRVQAMTSDEWEAKYNKLLERAILLENEAEEKVRLDEETQRLRDELRGRNSPLQL
jgi:predicted RNase H-like nuclease (RuvC/YqgF family)